MATSPVCPSLLHHDASAVKMLSLSPSDCLSPLRSLTTLFVGEGDPFLLCLTVTVMPFNALTNLPNHHIRYLDPLDVIRASHPPFLSPPPSPLPIGEP